MKADKSEINKTDLNIKVKEKQVENMIVIVIEMIRLHLQASKHMDSTIISQFKYILKQALTIFQWMKGNNKTESKATQQFTLNFEDNEEDSNMIKVRPIFSTIEKHRDTIDSTDQPQLTNRVTETLDIKLENGKDTERVKPINLFGNSSKFEEGKNMVLPRKGKGLKTSPRFMQGHRRLYTSQGFYESHRSKKRTAKINIPHLNFPDPISLQKSKNGLGLRNSSPNEMIVLGQK